MGIDGREKERLRMVETQIAARGVRDERVLSAMREVPRHLFVPESYQTAAYNDSPLPIGKARPSPHPISWR